MEGKGGREAATEGQAPIALGSAGQAGGAAGRRGGQVGRHGRQAGLGRGPLAGSAAPRSVVW